MLVLTKRLEAMYALLPKRLIWNLQKMYKSPHRTFMYIPKYFYWIFWRYYEISWVYVDFNHYFWARYAFVPNRLIWNCMNNHSAPLCEILNNSIKSFLKYKKLVLWRTLLGKVCSFTKVIWNLPHHSAPLFQTNLLRTF